MAFMRRYRPFRALNNVIFFDGMRPSLLDIALSGLAYDDMFIPNFAIEADYGLNSLIIKANFVNFPTAMQLEN